ncbi:MAG: tRNA adenosine(34) deaminase TadA [Actinobacteria bacterium]|nr:tRNA adenosine(34) deaminase TadA [Actinomycetota bacterium]
MERRLFSAISNMSKYSYESKDEKYMREALKEAEKAAKKGEVPIGAVIVKEGKVIGRGHNLRETKNDPTAHAEIIAIRQAAKKLKNWRLSGCTLYVTVEPCPMCAGAIVLSRIERVVYGAEDNKAGAVKSLYSLLSDERLNHRVSEIISGVEKERSTEILKDFFQKLRQANNY